MRSIHFRVSDAIYTAIQEQAETQGVSVAHFSREATIVRMVAWAARRGDQLANVDAWEQVLAVVEENDRRDAKLRAQVARARRDGDL